MSDRRYRQSGYRDASSAKQGTPGRAPFPSSPTTFASRPVSRCAECGAALPITAESLTHCPSCRIGLHSCRQCGHFDPGQRFECSEAISEAIVDKRAPNDCDFFSLRVTVERDTSSGAVRPDDARRSFGILFK